MEDNNSNIEIIKILKKVGQLLKQRMETQFKEMNLTGPQGMLLGILFHDGEMKVSDLSEKLGLSNSTVSGIIDRLERQDFVQRIRSSEDRRVVYVNVTEAYKRSAKEKFNKFEKYFEDIMKESDLEEINCILNGLRTLEKVLERQTETSKE